MTVSPAASTLLEKVFKTYLTPIVPPKTLLLSLEYLSNPNTRPQDIVSILSQNQAYVHLILNYSLIQSKVTEWEQTEKCSPTEMIVRLAGIFGKSGTRSLVSFIGMSRTNQNVLKKKGERLKGIPQDKIKYALLAADVAEELGRGSVSEAFCAGLLYDWLFGILSAAKMTSDTKNYIDKIWKEALRSASLASSLGGSIKDLGFERYLFASGLILPIGKILMDQIYPKELGDRSWSMFLNYCDFMIPNRSIAIHLIEKRKFEICHWELSALLTRFFKILEPIEKALYFYKEPFSVKQESHDLCKLSCVLYLTDWQSGPEKDRPPLYYSHLRALEFLGLNQTQLSDIVKKTFQEEKK